MSKVKYFEVKKNWNHLLGKSISKEIRYIEDPIEVKVMPTPNPNRRY